MPKLYRFTAISSKLQPCLLSKLTKIHMEMNGWSSCTPFHNEGFQDAAALPAPVFRPPCVLKCCGLWPGWENRRAARGAEAWLWFAQITVCATGAWIRADPTFQNQANAKSFLYFLEPVCPTWFRGESMYELLKCVTQSIPIKCGVSRDYPKPGLWALIFHFQCCFSF